MAKRRGFNFAALSVLSALAALGGTYLYLTQFSESGKLSIVERFDPTPDVDSYLEGIEGIKYREDGAVAYRWRAVSAERYISDGSVRLQEPFYLGNIAEQRPWTATAAEGRLNSSGQHLQLNQNVVVRELIRQAEIRTNVLKIDLQESVVSTDQALTLLLPNGTTKATGMYASLREERVELLNNVRGHYAPR